MHLLDLMEVHATKRSALRLQVAASTAWSHSAGSASAYGVRAPASALPWVPAHASLPICTLYRGRLRSSVTCRSCGYASNSYDPYETLSLEITQCATVEESLARFSLVEVGAFLSGMSDGCESTRTPSILHSSFLPSPFRC